VYLNLIACEALAREVTDSIAACGHHIHSEFLTRDLHNQSRSNRISALQAAVDRARSARYEAILLAYGDCGSGLAGLTAREIPLVVPRARDCLHLALGKAARKVCSSSTRGACFRTTGWIRHSAGGTPLTRPSGLPLTPAELMAKYGRENANLLQNEASNYLFRYRQLTFISSGEDERGGCPLENARRGWDFSRISPDLALIQDLSKGRWDADRFLIVEPGCRVPGPPGGESFGAGAHDG
jgi:hypothetical protein